MPTAEAHARAALAGNPSDGYGGAVLALALPMFRAEVSVSPDPGGPVPELIAATLARFERDFGLEGGVYSWDTTIPRSVGLGGSSALIIATLRALCELHGVDLAPSVMAELALSIERDDLGIAAGLQDRVAQSYGGLTFMEFDDPPVYERLDPDFLPPLVVAWREHTAEHSGVVHNDLRSRFDAGDRTIHNAMRELAHLARSAKVAVLAGDRAELARCADASFDARARIMSLNPSHVEMVKLGRTAGAGVNYTGSGGAVICVCSDAAHRDTVDGALRSGGCRTVRVG